MIKDRFIDDHVRQDESKEFISHSVPDESGLDESRIEIIENDENNSERQASGSKESNEPLNDEEINQPDEEEIAEIKEEENSSIDSNDSREQNTSVQQQKQPNRGLDQAVMIENEFNKFVDTIVKENQELLKGKRFNAEKQAKLDALVNSSPYGYLKVRNRIMELRRSAKKKAGSTVTAIEHSDQVADAISVDLSGSNLESTQSSIEPDQTNQLGAMQEEPT
jgi:hypothetical protein